MTIEDIRKLREATGLSLQQAKAIWLLLEGKDPNKHLDELVEPLEEALKK